MKRKTFLKNIKIISVILIISCVFAVTSFVSLLNDSADFTASEQQDFSDFTIIIDPGHGGEDGGAVGISGALEKDINLSLSKKLYSLFSLTDINVIMTRSDDRLLYNEGQSNSKKYHDVRNRAAFVEQYEKPLFISIHQNKFPIAKYNGLQVYYSKNNPDSMKLAQSIQSKVRTYLQQKNNRKIKASGASIYLMKNLDCPAVLVECGFMSNPEEEAKLSDEDYQMKIAFAVFSSVIDYFSENNNKREVLQ